MGLVMNIPEWFLIVFAVWMAINSIKHVNTLYLWILLKGYPFKSFALPKIKWPSWKFKRPRWMKFSTGLNRMHVQSNASHDDYKQCKGCGGATKLLVDGLCVGCRRE